LLDEVIGIGKMNAIPGAKFNQPTIPNTQATEQFRDYAIFAVLRVDIIFEVV
jgi:hypothetical protein